MVLFLRKKKFNIITNMTMLIFVSFIIDGYINETIEPYLQNKY